MDSTKKPEASRGQTGQNRATGNQQSFTRQPANISGDAANSTPRCSCPYHDSVLQMNQALGPQGQDPTRRFLDEGVAEQSALFNRPDNGNLSTYRGCTCVASTQYYAYPRELAKMP